MSLVDPITSTCAPSICMMLSKKRRRSLSGWNCAQAAGALCRHRAAAHEHAYRHAHARADLDADARTITLADCRATQPLQRTPFPLHFSYASVRRSAPLRWQVPPSTLPTLAPFMPAASPTLALIALARTGVPTVVPTQVRLSEPSRAAELSNELVPKHDVVRLWWSRMMVSVWLDSASGCRRPKAPSR